MPLDTPLHKAATKGDTYGVEAYLEEHPDQVRQLISPIGTDMSYHCGLSLFSRLSPPPFPPPPHLLLVQIDVRGAQNRTALHRAISSPNAQSLVEVLLSYKANPNLTDSGGLTPLHWSASFGIAAVGKLLISSKADVNAATNGGETALHMCAEKGDSAFVAMLLEHGADKTLRDKSPAGATPFVAAKRGGNAECIRALRLKDDTCCVIM
jgi:ankyrin repeat protein